MKKLHINKIKFLLISTTLIIMFSACKKSDSNIIHPVTHLSFWTEGQLAKYIKLEATFRDTITGNFLTNKLVTITSTNYGTTKGYTDSIGTVTGLVPANEILVMNVFDDCGNIIYTQNIGPFSTDKNLGTLYISHAAAPLSFTVRGAVVSCGDIAVAKGSVILSIGTDHYNSDIVNGNFNLTFTRCNDSLSPATLVAYDSVNNQSSAPQTININAGSQNIGQIKACPAPPVAGFTYNTGSGSVPDTVTFSNTSTNATSYSWNFGDGATSTLQNPVHIYTTVGDYTITLTATGSGGTNSNSQPIHIALISPIAGFTFKINYNGVSGSVRDSVTFSNTSTNAASYVWDFGDGTNSTVQNPVHIYTTAGNYTVTLTATGSGGTNSSSKIINITSTPPPTICDCSHRPIPPGCYPGCGIGLRLPIIKIPLEHSTLKNPLDYSSSLTALALMLPEAEENPVQFFEKDEPHIILLASSTSGNYMQQKMSELLWGTNENPEISEIIKSPAEQLNFPLK